MLELGYILRSAKTHPFLPAPPSLPAWVPPRAPRTVADLEAQGWGVTTKGNHRRREERREGRRVKTRALASHVCFHLPSLSPSLPPSLPPFAPSHLAGKCIFDVVLSNQTYYENAILGVPAFKLEDEFTHLYARTVRTTPPPLPLSRACSHPPTRASL